jgi:DNA-binding transcriptional MocR family regulator
MVAPPPRRAAGVRRADAISRTLTRLKTAGLTPSIESRGGVFLWARLSDGLDATAIAQPALAEGVGLAPGPVLSAAPDARLSTSARVSARAASTRSSGRLADP